MKKLFTLALLALSMLATTAKAQVNFGLKGGLNVTSMSFSDELFDASNRAGFFVGPTVKFTLPIVGLGIDASALYDQRSADVTASSTKETIDQKSINIPINLRYSVGLGSTANIFLFAGPQWGINIGDKNFTWTDQSSYSLKKSNFSVNVGLGVTMMSHLQLSANYNVACGKTADATLRSAVDQVLNTDKSRNNSWQVALAYYF